MNIDKKFVKNQAKSINQKDFKTLNKKKRKFQKIIALGVFSKQKNQLKLLFEVVQQYRRGTYRDLPWRSVSAIVFSLLYILNPLDIIPDVVPIFGFAHDVKTVAAISRAGA